MPVSFSNQRTKMIPTQPRRVKAKPAWSDYLTVDNKFALSNEEILRRRQTLLSKHNVFNGNTKSSSTRKSSIASRNHQGSSNTQRMTDTRCKNVVGLGPSEEFYEDDEAEGFPNDPENMDALDLVSAKHNKWYVSH